MIVSTGGTKKLVIANALTGAQEPALEAQGNIDSYSIDSSGQTAAYSVLDRVRKETSPKASPDSIARGYRVVFGNVTATQLPTHSIYIRHRDSHGRWSLPKQLSVQNPFTHVHATHILTNENFTEMSLSPNGKRLLFEYFTDHIPDEWKADPIVKLFSVFEILVLYDVDRGVTTLAFKSLSPASVPLWSNDSQSFLVNAYSPIGSLWEAEDIRDRRISGSDANLFEVNADSGEVTEVIRHVPDHHQPPLFWREDGDLIIQTAGPSVARLSRFKDAWREVERYVIPGKEGDRFSMLGSNGSAILGVHETVSAPQSLFMFEPGQTQIHFLTDLNPELRKLRFAPVQTIEWTTTEGLNVKGLLYTPPGYVPGRRSPLVIQTKGDQGWFACDSGFSHEPAFAPQPIATAGMMYLIRTTGEGFNLEDEIDKRSTGYPGNVNEAVQQMDIWDSAVNALDKRGMVDPTKVGIIGFSRTGFYVEFALVHSKIRYAAATAADNIAYSLSEYFLFPSSSGDEEQMYGGPPYGKTLENWEKYSTSFNLDKVHTPLLMEEMGYGTHDNVRGAAPLELMSRSEIWNGLTRLGRPVELYYYPDEEHQPDHPKARLASLQRNLDWYRFWLQGYEDDDPSKRDQYERWHALRKLHEQDIESEDHTSVSDTEKLR
jgi:dipeptidyl aminopeptidase/acylaminoacyl peptidase